jgi:hypothetical protein
MIGNGVAKTSKAEIIKLFFISNLRENKLRTNAKVRSLPKHLNKLRQNENRRSLRNR